jgi:Outer membrane protein beta-barrel domain
MKKIGFLGWVIFLSLPTLSQNKRPISPYEKYSTYSVGARFLYDMPQSGFDTYINKAGTGMALQGEMLIKKYSLGVELGYVSFLQRMPRAVYSTPSSDISAVQTRTFDMIPLMVTASYHLTPTQTAIRPYVQVGLGGNLVNYTNYWGLVDDGKSTFGLQLRAAAGLKWTLVENGFGAWGADLRVAYQRQPFSYDFISNANTMSASVGFFYRWW